MPIILNMNWNSKIVEYAKSTVIDINYSTRIYAKGWKYDDKIFLFIKSSMFADYFWISYT